MEDKTFVKIKRQICQRKKVKTLQFKHAIKKTILNTKKEKVEFCFYMRLYSFNVVAGIVSVSFTPSIDLIFSPTK
jgi:hypothetical protein